jgi:predicted transcriptional regulator
MKDLDTRKTLVKDIASKPLVTIDETQTLWSAAEIMSNNHIRRLPVKSKQEEIIGVLSTRAISDALPVISRFKEMQEILSNLRKMKHQD